MTSKPPLPEDVVEYYLFPQVPDNISSDEIGSFLKEQHDLYLGHLSHILIDYIWQKDQFLLVPNNFSSNIDSTVPCLKGSTNFGDNIEDEWVIVYILRELTSHFPGLTVRVIDNDGEFLLIEAANVLPKWLNPESGENRVYLHNGEVHIIPMPQSTDDHSFLPLFTPTTPEAIECIRNHGNVTRATDPIQNCVRKRISRYPKSIRDNTHHTNCYIPAALAAILTECPGLIAPAVQAFYYRDPVDLKSCRTMTYFRPGTRVLHRVKMTRCLYAQLMGQRFAPDRRSGWIMPATAHRDFKAHDLGMKLSHGFEILCAQSSTIQNGCEDDESIVDTSGIRWNRFIKSLRDNGYFRGQLEGSSLYKSLLKDAHQFYLTSITHTECMNDKPGKKIISLLNTVKYDIEAMRKVESRLPPPDDDSWMEIKPEDLDQMLNERSGVVSAKLDDKQLAESMKAFVQNESSHEGAEFPGEMDDTAELQSDNMGFIHSMQKMFDFQDDDGDSNSSSEMDEYDWDSDDEKRTMHHAPPPTAAPRPAAPRPAAPRQAAPRPAAPRPAARKVTDQGSQSGQALRSGQASLPNQGSHTGQCSGSSNERRRGGDERTVEDYMDMMDRELANTNIGKSFERQSKPVAPPRRRRGLPNGSVDRDINNEDDGFRPVDIDRNTVKNMLESYSSQQGLPGPASNILTGMGVRFQGDTK